VCAQEGAGSFTNRHIEKKSANKDEDVPYLVAMTKEVKSSGPPLFGELGGIEDEAQSVTSKRRKQLVEEQVRLNTATPHIALHLRINVHT
jgi:hypothetical protein